MVPRTHREPPAEAGGRQAAGRWQSDAKGSTLSSNHNQCSRRRCGSPSLIRSHRSAATLAWPCPSLPPALPLSPGYTQSPRLSDLLGHRIFLAFTLVLLPLPGIPDYLFPGRTARPLQLARRSFVDWVVWPPRRVEVASLFFFLIRGQALAAAVLRFRLWCAACLLQRSTYLPLASAVCGGGGVVMYGNMYIIARNGQELLLVGTSRMRPIHPTRWGAELLEVCVTSKRLLG